MRCEQLLVLSVGICSAAVAVPSVVRAYPITEQLEAITITGLGTGFTPVTFENEYISPVVVCNGQAASSASWLPLVRLRNVSIGGMEARVQKFSDTPDNYPTTDVFVGDVYCLVSEAGAHQLPDDTWYHAGRTNVGATTNGHSWNTNVNPMVRVNNLTGNMVGPLAVLGQVMTQADARPQAAHVRGSSGATGCAGRQTDPFAGGVRTSFCIGRHSGYYSLPRAGETLGWIAFPRGSDGFVASDGKYVEYGRGKTSDSVRDVLNAAAPYTFGTTVQLDMAVTTQQAEDGGDGSYSGLFGGNPLAGSNIRMALDESANRDRAHTTEPVGWWGFGQRDTEIEVTKDVDITSTSDYDLLTYTIEVDNTGEVAFEEVVLDDDLLQDTTALTLASGPTLVASSDTDGDGELDDDETWEYTATYQLTDTNFDAIEDVVNTVQVLAAIETGGDPLDPVTADATTQLIPDPKMLIEKVATLSGGGAIPATGVSAGDDLVYTYTLENAGNVGMNTVTLTDDHKGSGVLNFQSCTETTDANSNSIMGGVPFQIAFLGAGDTAECTVTYTVTQADVDSQ